MAVGKAIGQATQKLLEKIKQTGDLELTDAQIDSIISRHPEAYERAMNTYNRRLAKNRQVKNKEGKTVTAKVQPSSTPASQSRVKPKTRKARRAKEPESISSIQRDATDIGEAAARDAIARGVYKPSGSVKSKGRGAGAKSSKPKSTKPKSTKTTATKTTATTGKGLATTGSTTKRRGGGAKTQQAVNAKAKELSKGTRVTKGGAARKKRRMTRAEAAAAGAAAGVAVGVANQKNKTKTTNTTGTKPTPPKTPKGRSGNIGRTYMGDFATKAKVAAKPKKKYGESGMGMKAYQNMMFNRRK